MAAKKKKRIIILLVLLVVLLPLWMWMAWLFTPKKKMVMAIVDKTEITRDGQEHVSLTWILNHHRYTKTPTKGYNVSDDYFGFFPKSDEKFRLKGLERFSEQQLDQLSKDCSVAYFTDTYGVYNNEWYGGKASSERSGILYGGMSQQDIRFLQLMKEKKKLIITEFNCISSPTAPGIREQFQNMFGMQWSGWIGRYFESLDTTINKELPHWLINNYLRQHGNKWPFTKAGIALVSDKDEIEILEQDRDLKNPIPQIVTTDAARKKYDLPHQIKYTFWFDIMHIDTTVNKALASFELEVNEAGKQLLASHGLKPLFPAVTAHLGTDYQFYYFSADFCDNPVRMITSYFRGVGFFKSLFYKDEPGERGSFFWNYYRPLVSRILEDHYEKIK